MQLFFFLFFFLSRSFAAPAFLYWTFAVLSQTTAALIMQAAAGSMWVTTAKLFSCRSTFCRFALFRGANTDPRGCAGNDDDCVSPGLFQRINNFGMAGSSSDVDAVNLVAHFHTSLQRACIVVAVNHTPAVHRSVSYRHPHHARLEILFAPGASSHVRHSSVVRRCLEMNHTPPLLTSPL